MAVCILIFLLIRNELSYDKFHEKSDQIYRIVYESEYSGKPFHMAPTMLPLAPAVKNDFAEISHVARISLKSSMLLRFGDQAHYERMQYVDPDIFDIFTIPFVIGNPQTALDDPYTIVLTEKTANKYFGDEDPLGKIITIQNNQDYKVTGVLKDYPKNSHIRITALASFSSLNNTERVKSNDWTHFYNDYTYLLLPDNYNPADLENKFPAFLEKYTSSDDSEGSKLHLQALKDIHFSTINYDYARTNEKKYLYAFGVIGFFILFIACINFMNLATARSTRRAKEVGMRKVVGAQRFQLIKQFLAESILMSSLAIVVAVLLVKLILPEFSDFLRKDFAFHLFSDRLVMVGLASVAVVVGILSGFYPALFLSAFKPIKILQGVFKKSEGGFSFRRIFVVFQFAISIILIIATLVVYDQLNFMQQKELGFEKEQIIVISMNDSEIKKNHISFKTEILRNLSIVNMSFSSGSPACGHTNASGYYPEGFKKDEDVYMETIYADFDFIKTLGLKIVQGRGFLKEFSSDMRQAYIINETALKKIGWDYPIGKFLSTTDGDSASGQIVGVVEDFHYGSMRSKIAPIALTIDPSQYDFISVKIQSEDIAKTLSFIEETWKAFAPSFPFDYYFMDNQFDSFYRFEQRLGKIFTYCSLLAIFISCLGIFGLISFAVEQRTKEIGIRKVLGASIFSVVVILIKEFIKWVLIANVIAWPIAYFAMNQWLQQFAYRTSPGLSSFLISTIAAIVIAIVTVSWQAIKAAVANPVDALKYE